MSNPLDPVLSRNDSPLAALTQHEQRKTSSKLHDEFISICLNLTDHLFNQAIQKFTQLAAEATTDQALTNYQCAEREVRDVRLAIATDFVCVVDDFFKALIEDKNQETLNTVVHQESLSLISHDHLEVDIVVNKMVKNARETNEQTLAVLQERMKALFPNGCITEDNNPLDPKFLIERFIQLCEKTFLLDIEPRMKFYQVFELSFVEALQSHYRTLNNLLAQEGVLPDLSYKDLLKTNSTTNTKQKTPSPQAGANSSTVQRAPRSAYSPSTAPDEKQQSVPADNVVFSPSPQKVSEWIATMGTIPDKFAGSQSANSDDYRFYSPSAKQISTENLIEKLDQKQLSVDDALAGASPLNVLSKIVHQSLSSRTSDKKLSISQVDEAVVHLVGIFFDELLKDKNVAHAVQVLVCRLQIPVLKIALNNHHFFSEHEHPARVFINKLIAYGQPFHDNAALEKDTLYIEMKKAVTDIIGAIQYSADLFALWSNKLERAQQQAEKRRFHVEKRTQLTEEGQARLHRAKKTAHLVTIAAKERSRLNAFDQFAEQYWKQVLVLTHLKQGMTSDTWQTVAKLCLHSASFFTLLAEKKGLQPAYLQLPTVTKLLDQLTKGIKFTTQTDAEAVDIVQSLCNAMSQEAPSPKQVEPTANSAPQQDDPPALESVDKALSGLKMQLEQQKQEALRYLGEVKSMQVGTWVDYYLDNKRGYKVCKLSKIIEDEFYLFTGRLGAKVVCKPIDELAHDLACDSLTVLGGPSSFDKLMTLVMQKLGLSY